MICQRLSEGISGEDANTLESPKYIFKELPWTGDRDLENICNNVKHG